MDKTILELRELRAKDLIRYFNGADYTTQLGECYKIWIVPTVLTSNCRSYTIEWGIDAGFPDSYW